MHRSPFDPLPRAQRRVVSLAALTALGLTAGAALADISQSGEQRNMRRVGHSDLQGRAAYHPNVIVYPDGRSIWCVEAQNFGQLRMQAKQPLRQITLCLTGCRMANAVGHMGKPRAHHINHRSEERRVGKECCR